MNTSLAHRRRILGTNCINEKEAFCPKVIYYKSTNGTVLNGNMVIKGSEFSQKRQYGELVNRQLLRPVGRKLVFIKIKLDAYGNKLNGGGPLPARMPPNNFK